MRSYIQGLITGGVFVFAFIVLNGSTTQSNMMTDELPGRYIFSDNTWTDTESGLSISRFWKKRAVDRKGKIVDAHWEYTAASFKEFLNEFNKSENFKEKEAEFLKEYEKLKKKYNK